MRQKEEMSVSAAGQTAEKSAVQLTEKERKKQIKLLWGRLRELMAVPRSDWHTAFEAILLIDLHKYGSRVSLVREQVLGAEPPRVDYLIVTEDESVAFEKEFFRMFRKFNVIEYKNPEDALNERVIRKICGYANFYIGIAEHEGDVPAKQVTISIFRAKKNRELFRRMEKAGQLVKGNAQGIYYVKGLTDLPFQIVITGELAGAEYAAYRALTEGADKTDVEQIIEDVEKETDSVIRRHYQILLSQISRKNIETMESIRGENEMEDALMELLRDRIDREISEREQQVKQQEKLIAIKNVMKSLRISEEKAMDVLDIPQSQRETYMGLLIREK